MYACILSNDCPSHGAIGLEILGARCLCLVAGAVPREITFKTDPEKGDYELETGASRNFESWTDKQATEDEHKKARYVCIMLVYLVPGRY